MKKQLLLLVAIFSCFMLNAQSTAGLTIDTSEADELINPLSIKYEVATAVTQATPTDSEATSTPPQKADSTGSDYTPIPLYDVNGVFYDGIKADETNSGTSYYYRYPYFPPFSKLTYENYSKYSGTAPDTTVWEWSVPKISSVDLSARSFKYLYKTSDSITYETDFTTPYMPWAGARYPTLTMDSVIYRVGYTNTSGTEYYRAQWGGKRTTIYTDAEVNLWLTYFPANTIQSYSALTSDYGISNTVRLGSMSFNSNYFTSIDENLSIATLLYPADSRVYGFSQVLIKAYITKLSAGGKFKLDIYKITPNLSASYYSNKFKVGERVGGGYLDTDSYAEVTGKTKYIAIPVIDYEGDERDSVEMQTFYNVTEPVIVVVSLECAPDAEDDLVQPFPVFVKNSDSSPMRHFGRGGVYVQNFPENDEATRTTSGNIVPTFYPLFYSTTTFTSGLKLNPIGWDMEFDIQYSYLFEDGSHPELTATLPAAGGSQSFDFTPSIDLYNAVFTTSDGSQWAFAYPDDEYVEYSTQKLIIEADPLPDGVKGRQTTVKVQIQGDEIEIPVIQGDVSGLDTVANDSKVVVSSQLYDLQGRRLNAVPESGLYIRRDVNEDNTVTTTKVTK